MFQNHDMVSKQHIAIIVIVAIASSITLLYELRVIDSCNVQKLDIESKISQYTKTRDPLFCNSLNEEITQFNSQCKSDLEIQDCG